MNKDNIWNYFDSVYILTLENSKRLKPLLENLDSVGIDNYKIFPFKRGSKTENNGEDSDNLSFYNIVNHNVVDKTAVNISKNHIHLIRHAFYNNLENVIILEDDARFELPLQTNKLTHITTFLKGRDWDIFYFGHMPHLCLINIPVSKYIVKPLSPYLAHCYCLSRSGMSKVLQNVMLYDGIHFDKWLNQISLRRYACFLSMNYQEDAPALYYKSLELLGLNKNISFKQLNKIFEYISVIIFILLLILVLCIVIFKIYYSQYLVFK